MFKIHALGSYATENFDPFEQTVNHRAAMLCTDLHVDGLMGILIKETLPDAIGSDGVAVPSERISFPRSEAIS